MRPVYKTILILSLFALVAGGCGGVELKREVPSSPKESYELLPR